MHRQAQRKTLCRPRQRRRFCLTRRVEVLVPSILAASSGLVPHRRHAKTHEPNADPGQPDKAAAAERRPALAQHVLRQPEGAEGFFQPPPNVVGLARQEFVWAAEDAAG
jgi:hypothetical protein